MNILIAVAPMVPVLLILLGFGVWWSRGEVDGWHPVRPTPTAQNLTRVVPIAPSRLDRDGLLAELCDLARREVALRGESVRAAAGDRPPLSNEERFVMRVLADRVDVLRAHQLVEAASDQLLLDVEALDHAREQEQLVRTLRSVPQPNSVA